jgi:MFS superfamily sulfate permease-like transporter
MTGKYETSIYSRQQLENVRLKSQVKGWLQGAGSVFLLIMLLKFIGWIPVVLLISVIGFAGFKIFSKYRRAGKESGE